MPRKIRVVTTCQNYNFRNTIEGNLEWAGHILDLACRTQPDLICLPENFATASVSGDRTELAQSVPGPITDVIGKKAAGHRTYIICPMLTHRDGKVHNSAVIIDRKGGITGIYDKVHPVTSTADYTEVEHGVTPGLEAGVFDLDFGKVGLQICFDIGFPETWKNLAEKGSELVVWPSAYDGGFPLKVYAYLNSYYVVSSVRSSNARIINPLGEVLEHTGRHLHIASRMIDLDYMVCHCDFHSNIPETLTHSLGAGVTVRMANEEGRFLVESNLDNKPLEVLVAEFGLEDVETYHERHRRAYPALRENGTPPAQTTPYKNRPQYG